MMALYLDGKCVATRDIRELREDYIDSDSLLTIGSGSSLPWNGLVDDVRIYKRTLTKEESQGYRSRHHDPR